jgi:hypothetical protein
VISCVSGVFSTKLFKHPVFDIPDDNECIRLFFLYRGSIIFVLEESHRCNCLVWRRIVSREGMGWMRATAMMDPERDYYMVQL